MEADFSVGHKWPNVSAELDPTETFVVWSYRSWAMAIQSGGQQRWRLLGYEYRRKFGPRTCQSALERFNALMRQIGSHTRTPLKYHSPCCPCLGPQEVATMSLLAACQSRHWSLARSIAACLVKADGVGAVISAAAEFADIMRRHLPVLPARLLALDPAVGSLSASRSAEYAPGTAAPPANVTLH